MWAVAAVLLPDPIVGKTQEVRIHGGEWMSVREGVPGRVNTPRDDGGVKIRSGTPKETGG